MSRETYRRPPITEAVIEFRLTSAIDKLGVDAISDELQRRYPHKQDQFSFDVQIDTAAAPPLVRSNVKPLGARLASEDQADMVILQENSITTVRLAPYQGWEKLVEQAKSNWKIWRKRCRNIPVGRVGIRYINRIDVPTSSGHIRVKDFIRIVPEDPLDPKGERPLTGYLAQLTARTPQPPWAAQITSTPVNPPPLVNHVSLLLDIDVSAESDIPSSGQRIWDFVDAARPVKNWIFETCITENSRALFDK